MGNTKIAKFDASNLRSQIITEDNQVWYWGGYVYDGRKRSSHGLKNLIEGFNLLNEEEGIPLGKNIHTYGMGFAHDTVMFNEQEAIETIETPTDL